MKKFKIKNRLISDETPPLIIGEVSANHSNSLKKIYKIIDIAREIKMEAIKFQTFHLDEMTLNLNKKEFRIKNKSFDNRKWNNRSLYSLYKEAKLPFEWHRPIFNYAKKKGIICFSSVFDQNSLVLLKSLNCPAYKIASLESLHFPLIKKVIKEKKPIIVSTGTLSMEEIDELEFFLKKNKAIYSILHCVTEYPANKKNCNLKLIPLFKKKFNCPVGYSDHTSDNIASLSAVSLGANIIEKHFKLNKKDKTLDSKFSIPPDEMEELIKKSKETWITLGKEKKFIEKKSYLDLRRSIYVTETINVGQKISKNNIKVIRPGHGIEPKHYDRLIGKRVKKKLMKGDALKIKYVT